MRYLFYVFFILNITSIEGQDCVFFSDRESLPEPLKNYQVFEYSPLSNKEELVLTVSYDSINKIFKKKYHKDFYVWAEGYQDPGIGITWFDDKNNPTKEITLRKGSSDDGHYNYWEYQISHYSPSGDLLISEQPNLKNLPISIPFDDKSLMGYLEKNYIYQTAPTCKSYYSYDNFRRVDLIRNYSIDGDSILNKHFYDEKNRVIMNRIIKNEKTIEETEFSYKDGYRTSNYFSYSYENGKQTRHNEKAIFKVMFDKNKLIYQSYSLNGTVLNETIYKYNIEGDLSECIQYQENKELKRILKYKYQ